MLNKHNLDRISLTQLSFSVFTSADVTKQTIYMTIYSTFDYLNDNWCVEIEDFFNDFDHSQHVNAQLRYNQQICSLNGRFCWRRTKWKRQFQSNLLSFSVESDTKYTRVLPHRFAFCLRRDKCASYEQNVSLFHSSTSIKCSRLCFFVCSTFFTALISWEIHVRGQRRWSVNRHKKWVHASLSHSTISD